MLIKEAVMGQLPSEEDTPSPSSQDNKDVKLFSMRRWMEHEFTQKLLRKIEEDWKEADNGIMARKSYDYFIGKRAALDELKRYILEDKEIIE